MARLAAIEGLRDLALTTNGYLLAQQAEALVAAGVDRVNVSIDSLARARFFEITRRDALGRVLEGLEAIAAFPQVRPIKVNAVPLPGLGAEEVSRFCELARRRDFQVRFIEFMPLDGDRSWRAEDVLSGAEVRAMVAAQYPLRELPREPHSTARVYAFTDGEGEIRLCQPGEGAVLRRLQPDPADRGREAADLPLLPARDRPAGAAARRRQRRGSWSGSSATRSGARS